MKNVYFVRSVLHPSKLVLWDNDDESIVNNFIYKVKIFKQNVRVMQSISYVYYIAHSKYLNNKVTRYFHDKFTELGEFRLCHQDLKRYFQTIIPNISDEEIKFIIKICNYFPIEKDSIPAALSELLSKLNCKDIAFLKQLELIRDSLKTDFFLQKILLLNGDFMKFFFITFQVKENVNIHINNLDFINLNLANAELSNYIFDNVTFTRGDFTETKFTKCQFRHVVFTQSILVKSRFESSKMYDVNFSLENLFNAKFIKNNLVSINFSGTDLIAAHFVENFMYDCSFGYANLRGAKILNSSIKIVDFRFAVFDDFSKIQITIPKFADDFEVINYFSAENNNFNIFTTINSILPDFSELRLSLMLQLINFLKNNENILKKVHRYIRKEIDNNSLYKISKEISTFIDNKILPIIIEESELKSMQFFNSEVNIIQNYLKTVDYFIKKCGFVNQFIYFCQLNLNPFVRTIAKTINEQSLKFPEITDVTNSITEIFADDIETYRIFFNKNLDKALVVHNDFLSKFLYNNQSININWNELLFFSKDLENNYIVNPLANIVLEEIFEEFILFKNAYSNYKKNSKFIKLIELIDLMELKEKFIDALYKTSCSDKLISSDSCNKLQEVFTKYLSEITLDDTEKLQNITIVNEHLNNIFKEFLKDNASEVEKANLLLCLSGIFARYSSDSYFGTDMDSPLYLRLYALALMNSAISLNNSLVDNKFLSDDVENWRYRFLGIKNAFSCTFVLSKMIIEHCKTNCKDTLEEIIPPQWCIT